METKVTKSLNFNGFSPLAIVALLLCVAADASIISFRISCGQWWIIDSLFEVGRYSGIGRFIASHTPRLFSGIHSPRKFRFTFSTQQLRFLEARSDFDRHCHSLQYARNQLLGGSL